jgi:hypothetical protein
MLHQDFGAGFDSVKTLRDSQTDGCEMLAYRSRCVKAPTEAELAELLRKAQERNHAERLTGLLIYDQGYFFQWLEGPESALNRVWNSIRRDPRHRQIEILREQVLPERFFASWDMRLARRTRDGFDTALTVAKAPDELLKKLHNRPTVLADSVWDRVFADVVVPRLGLKHAIPFADKRLADTDYRPADLHPAAAIWHANRKAGAELAGALLAPDGNESTLYLHGLIGEGAKLEPLFREVFEPAARCLGDLLEDGQCNDFNVTLAMGRLQLEVRRLSASFGREQYSIRPGHAILIAQQPGEAHGLAATMGSELFWRDGWDVSCEFPDTDSALRGLVRDQWFDVLDLSLSNAMLREHELQAMRVTIRAVQASSMNPALAILVEGRSFFERPRAYLDVGADIGCVSSTDAVLTAERLLDALASTKQPVAQPIAVSLNHYVNKLMPRGMPAR